MTLLSSKMQTSVSQGRHLIAGPPQTRARPCSHRICQHLETLVTFGISAALTSTHQQRSVVLYAAPPPQPASGAPPPPKKKAKKLVDINGDCTKDLGNGMFQIKLENGVTVMAHLSGKIRQNRIKIVNGDKVTVELSPYDLTKGRITYRFKPGEYEKLQAAAAEASARQT